MVITDNMIDYSKGFAAKRKGEIVARFDTRELAQEYIDKHKGCTLSFFLKEDCR